MWKTRKRKTSSKMVKRNQSVATILFTTYITSKILMEKAREDVKGKHREM
eukprot:m.308557 g.308557  ORF g.308557 m.308557 type:complete len:50 (+) comp44225_c0_seq1:615-764(+)